MAQMREKMMVIGAGLPRTGTMTMQAALQRLLDGKCYHMKEYAYNGTDKHTKHFRKAMEGKATKEEWIEFLEGFKACVDYPTSFFYKELADVFPDAKIVLTVREPEKWGESVQNTIILVHTALQNFPGSLVLRLFGGTHKNDLVIDICHACPKGLNHSMWSAAIAGHKTSRKFFNGWVEEVKRSIPADRLLIFQVKDGWGPLCKFLDLPVPNESFPHLNKVAEMKAHFSIIQKVGWAIVIGTPVVGAAAVGALYNYMF